MNKIYQIGEQDKRPLRGFLLVYATLLFIAFGAGWYTSANVADIHGISEGGHTGQ